MRKNGKATRRQFHAGGAALLLQMAAEVDGRDVSTLHARELIDRALGMLTRHQLSVDRAADECAALLDLSEPLKEYLADGDWQRAAGLIAHDVVATYLRALVNP